MDTPIMLQTAFVRGVEMPWAGAGAADAGKTLVILPGLSVKPVSPLMAAVVPKYELFLQNGYRLLLFDRRTNAPEGYSVTDMAEDTALVMESLGFGSADVFGASQGGMIAAALAATHPELVGHLMLGSTSLRHAESSDARFRRWIALAERKEEKALLTESGSAIYSPKSWAAVGEAFVNACAGITDAEYALFIRIASSLLHVDLLDTARRITAKTLVLGCRGDRVFTAGPSEQIARVLGCESYIYGEEYGHGVYDEAPDYTQRLLDFCER